MREPAGPGVSYAGGTNSMRSADLALYLAAAMVALAVLFVAYALSGADLCFWCGARG